MNKIIVNRDTMHWYGEPPCVPLGQQLFSQFNFSLSEDWNGATITAQFKQGDTILNIAVTDNSCFIPYGLSTGIAYVRLRGTFAKDDKVIATANELRFCIVQGFESGGSPSVPPTPDLYQTLLNTVQMQTGDLSKLTTKAKENLVAAINEAAKTGSGGGGDEWVKVAETTLTEIVNEIRLNFDSCKAVHIEFQYGAVEDDLGVIGIYPNPQTPIYTAENRSAAITQTTSAANKRGYIFCTIDRRKGTQWVATSQTFSRSDGAFGSIEPGTTMNCDIKVFNNNTWASFLMKQKLVGTDYIDSVSAFGAGMNIGTTLTVWGIKA